jgi:hypothetical protein
MYTYVCTHYIHWSDCVAVGSQPEGDLFEPRLGQRLLRLRFFTVLLRTSSEEQQQFGLNPFLPNPFHLIISPFHAISTIDTDTTYRLPTYNSGFNLCPSYISVFHCTILLLLFLLCICQFLSRHLCGNEGINKKKLHGLSPRANYTDRATAACRRSDCQLLRIECPTWSA